LTRAWWRQIAASERTWAWDCLREALPGCAVDQHDNSLASITTTFPGGGIGAVEVTAADQ
jgi:hypothetical protein